MNAVDELLGSIYSFAWRTFARALKVSTGQLLPPTNGHYAPFPGGRAPSALDRRKHHAKVRKGADLKFVP